MGLLSHTYHLSPLSFPPKTSSLFHQAYKAEHHKTPIESAHGQHQRPATMTQTITMSSPQPPVPAYIAERSASDNISLPSYHTDPLSVSSVTDTKRPPTDISEAEAQPVTDETNAAQQPTGCARRRANPPSFTARFSFTAKVILGLFYIVLATAMVVIIYYSVYHLFFWLGEGRSSGFG